MLSSQLEAMIGSHWCAPGTYLKAQSAEVKSVTRTPRSVQRRLLAGLAEQSSTGLVS